MKKSTMKVSIFLWVCMIIVGGSACGDSAGNDKADLIDTPIAKESGYVSTALPNSTVSLEDDTEVEGDLSGHDHTLSTEDNIVEHEKAGYCGNTVTKITRETQMGGESWEVSFWGSDSIVLTDLLLYLNYGDGICRCLPEYNVDTEFGTGYGINLTEGYVRHDGGKVILHQIGNKVYGYTTDNGTLMDLKMDGSHGYSDPTGVTEVGIAGIVDFSEAEYTVDKITYATGTYKGWDTFVADHQPVTDVICCEV